MIQMTAKWEPKKDLKEYYGAGKRPRVLDLPEMTFLAVEGQGAPEGEGEEASPFQTAIGAMYSVVYTMKFAMKAEGRDFGIPAIEAFWWADAEDTERAGGDFARVPLERWRWRLRVPVPGFVGEADVEAAKTAALERRGLEAIRQVELRRFAAGTCVQALHVGPYATEPETVARMHEFMEAQGLSRAPDAVHHEIYLGDPRRAAPERLRTILRVGVAAKG